MSRNAKNKRRMKKIYTCTICSKEFKWEGNQNKPPHRRLEDHKFNSHGLKPIRRLKNGYIRYEDDKENYQFLPVY